jgi:hypothetical protein
MINTEEDVKLVRNIKKGTNVESSLSELINRHSGIFITMINAYTPDKYREEMIQDKQYYIYQAAIKYDEEKNVKFPTYLGADTRWMCLNNYNKNKLKNEVDISLFENKIPYQPEGHAIQSKDSVERVLNMAKQHPDKRVGKIFDLRYGSDSNKLTPWSKVAPHVKLSVQGSINVHDEAIKSIKRKLQKEI